ncbi:MAG: 16S rRNA (cytosine(1402)-N(4))-methyltransferase RsmH, partial [Candidatus Latescibacterota bacterium]
MMTDEPPRRPVHEPVLVREVIEALSPFPGGLFVDATTGLGGHARAVLEEVDGIAAFVGIDRDGEMLAAAEGRLAYLPVPIELVQGDFRELGRLVGEDRRGKVGGILFDLGVASPHLDRPERGFSYRFGGALDMRLDRSQERSARDVVNGYSEEELERVIRTWGEERGARSIARAIVRSRETAPIEDTGRLAEIVSSRLPERWRTKGLSRVFQAIRIEVNDEIGALEEGLAQAVDVLGPGGRLAVISYHSLEDRHVKEKLREW